MFDWVTSPEAWAALVTLTALEIVLGIDNIVFISILSGRLPRHQQRKARLLGLGLAMAGRIALLLSIAWIMRLTAPLFALLGRTFSGRDLILLAGGLFLIGKSTHEIHHRLEGVDEEAVDRAAGTASFAGVITQILLLDLVFSLDSVITAVGMARHVPVMVVAIVLAVLVMMVLAEGIARFIERHPTIKMLALSFLLLIGVMLVAEGFGQHIPRGYIYSAMAFSLFVELLNIKAGARRAQPVRLHQPGLKKALEKSTSKK
ncbi:TerC family protein [Rhodothermus marinus]|uniref:Integral membrane protein TerC n=1 Tax=Rhodothermus marinus (strain ATCC 43812 / DSM 4252 / R-10) TaxID=518766 RepID=D0MDV8_RHOM4|nr:TerC family protein [Rhodothermus marinus]ACY49102.1 Integral membrane protein TerC [Rhodothermus marinus DSM 4252]